MAVWDIAALPTGEQFSYWREVICEAFVPLNAHRSSPDGGFAAKVETRPLAGVNRARLRSQPQRTDHGPREVARTDEAFYFVNLQLAGRCATTVGGRTSVTGPGDFEVVDTTEPYYFHLDRPWQMFSFRVPHGALTTHLAGRRPQLNRAFPGTGASAAVTALMPALWSVPGDAPGADELVESFATAVAAVLAERAAPDAVRPSGTGVTRAAIVAYARGRLGDRGLTVEGVCRRFAISPRTLHNLFAGGESFAATVRGLRLERCAALLADPGTTTTVTALALAHGFDDPSSFSRAFRRRFGVSPREMRSPRDRGPDPDAGRCTDRTVGVHARPGHRAAPPGG